MAMQQIPRAEHPRPDFERENWMNLNGTWQFDFDDADVGRREKWYLPGRSFGREILVPFAYQTRASGIGPTDEIHPVLWYRRVMAIPERMKGKRILLHFGAVDFEAEVYVNGESAGTHRGGYTPFTLDITRLLRDGENDLCLRAEDRIRHFSVAGRRPGMKASGMTAIQSRSACSAEPGALPISPGGWSASTAS